MPVAIFSMVVSFDAAINFNFLWVLGNSLTEYAGDWNVLLKARHIRNRGIAGDDAEGIYQQIKAFL